MRNNNVFKSETEACIFCSLQWKLYKSRNFNVFAYFLVPEPKSVPSTVGIQVFDERMQK